MMGAHASWARLGTSSGTFISRIPSREAHTWEIFHVRLYGAGKSHELPPRRVTTAYNPGSGVNIRAAREETGSGDSRRDTVDENARLF